MGQQASRTAKRRQTAARNRSARVGFLARKAPESGGRFWHGGSPGLEPGTVLLGRAEAESTGAVSPARYEQQHGYALGLTSPERVYFSSSREFAEGFAARFTMRDDITGTGVVMQHGALYEVEPLGPIEVDPDFESSGVSWCAPRARIVSIANPDVRLDPHASTERIGPYQTWSDGTPVYERNGVYRRSPEQAAAGNPQALFDAFTPWTPVEFINNWVLQDESGDRPAKSRFAAIAAQASSGIEVALRNTHCIRGLVRDGADFSDEIGDRIDDINAVLAPLTVLTPDDRRLTFVATHPDDGVVGVCVLSAKRLGDQLAVLIDAVAVVPTWRRRGLGRALILTGQRLLPQPPTIVAGQSPRSAMPFLAQSGFTMLRPGTPMRFPQGAGASRLASADADECWFYRQGRI